MKKHFFLGVILLLISSCSKETPTASNNYFSIGQATFQITNASLLAVEQISDTDTPPYRQTLIFTAKGLDVSSQPGSYFMLQGQGSLIGMVCYSSQKNTLDPGTYFVSLRPPYQQLDMPVGFYNLRFEALASERVDYWNFAGNPLLSGKMIVNNDNGRSKIECTFNAIDNTKVVINYYGTLQTYSFRYQKGNRIR